MRWMPVLIGQPNPIIYQVQVRRPELHWLDDSRSDFEHLSCHGCVIDISVSCKLRHPIPVAGGAFEAALLAAPSVLLHLLLATIASSANWRAETFVVGAVDNSADWRDDPSPPSISGTGQH